jgi:tRNA (adenine22-N1)-methyltransferase
MDAVIASDISAPPLERGRELALRCGVADKITFIQADGIPDALRGAVDTVIISGMGGETIAGILAAAPWLSDGGVCLILQPQSRYEILEAYLRRSGYAISDCELTQEGKSVYLIFSARGGASGEQPTILQMLTERGDALFGAFLDRQIRHTQKVYRGLVLENSPDAPDALTRLTRLKELRGGIL